MTIDNIEPDGEDRDEGHDNYGYVATEPEQVGSAGPYDPSSGTMTTVVLQDYTGGNES